MQLLTKVKKNTDYYMPMYLPFLCSLFLHTTLSYCLQLLHFKLQDFLWQFIQGRSSGKELLSFCVSENDLIFPLPLEDSFAGYRIFWVIVFWVFFSVFFFLLAHEYIDLLPAGLQSS